MKKSSEEFVIRGDDPVEALLEQAAPRAAPPSNVERLVRNSVHAEWQSATGKRRTRRRLAQFAMAASVVLAVTVTFNALQKSSVPAVQVATITKNHGSIYLVGEQSLLQKMNDLSSVFAGQIIETGADAGLGLEWGDGGSLRIDKNTRVEFTSSESVYLRSGRIYFDSQLSTTTVAITGSSLEIETKHGVVTHLGTQYMTSVDFSDLIVSVREGEVAVDGVYVEEAVAVAGQQMTVSGGARPSVVDFSGHGAEWSWVEAASPPVQLDGKPMHELLRWVSRETGLELIYEGKAEQMATSLIHADVVGAPRDKLFLLATANLQAHIDEDGGTINVSALDAGHRP